MNGDRTLDRFAFLELLRSLFSSDYKHLNLLNERFLHGSFGFVGDDELADADGNVKLVET